MSGEIWQCGRVLWTTVDGTLSFLLEPPPGMSRVLGDGGAANLIHCYSTTLPTLLPTYTSLGLPMQRSPCEVLGLRMDDEVIQVAVGLLSSDNNILQQYLQNGSSTHHFIRKLMLITAQSITATQRPISHVD